MARTKQPKIAGDTTSEEVIASMVQRVQRTTADKTQKRGKTTSSTAKLAAVLNNDGVHRRNESDRQLDGRDDLQRDTEVPTQFREAKRLDGPPPRANYVNWWVRYRADNAEDAENLENVMEEGWRPVERTRVHKTHELMVSSKGNLGRYYIKRGMILMEIPQQLKIQRDRYYNGLARRLQEGVDNNMFKEQHRAMPFLRPERATRITTRARRGRLEVAPNDTAEA